MIKWMFRQPTITTLTDIWIGFVQYLASRTRWHMIMSKILAGNSFVTLTMYIFYVVIQCATTCIYNFEIQMNTIHGGIWFILFWNKIRNLNDIVKKFRLYLFCDFLFGMMYHYKLAIVDTSLSSDLVILT